PVAEHVVGRVVDGNDGNVAATLEVNELGHGCHGRLLCRWRLALRRTMHSARKEKKRLSDWHALHLCHSGASRNDGREPAISVARLLSQASRSARYCSPGYCP